MNRWPWLSERNLFYGVLVLGVLLLMTVKFYPSMDGASHLYNANLIGHLLKGDSAVLGSYYTLNNGVIPNWTSFALLSVFNLFFPAWISEKILLVLYLLGMAFSFRLLISQLNPENKSLSILILPFSYSFLFHLGFYNYSLSFIFLFYTLYYYLKHKDDLNLLTYISLFILLGLTYFSAILTFFFLGFCLGLFILIFSFTEVYHSKDRRLASRKPFKELFYLFLISLPWLIFSYIFSKTTTFYPTDQHYSAGELTKWLNDVRCLIVYDYNGEEKLTEQFLHVSLVIIALSLFIRFYQKKGLTFINCWKISDVFMLPLVLSLGLLFVVPNGANAGMMSDRFCLLSFLFFIIWVASQSLPKRISLFLAVFIVAIHIGLLFKRHNGAIRNLDKEAKAIYNASLHIEKDGIVLPVNLSDNWLAPNFSNYLGADKSMVILVNYEACLGWFPVQWNYSKLPRLTLGENDSVHGLHWATNTASTVKKAIGYVFLYGNTQKINDPDWSDFKKVLTDDYHLIYTYEDRYVAVYKTN